MAIMTQTNGPWVQWCLTSQSNVGVQCSGEPALALSPVQQPLESFIGQLEASGEVPVKIFRHTVQRISGQTGRYVVKNEGPALIVVKQNHRNVGITSDNVARFINIHGLKTAAHSEINWQLTYCPHDQKLIWPAWPQVHLKASVRLAPQEALCIAAPVQPPGAMGAAGPL